MLFIKRTCSRGVARFSFCHPALFSCPVLGLKIIFSRFSAVRAPALGIAEKELRRDTRPTAKVPSRRKLDVKSFPIIEFRPSTYTGFQFRVTIM